MDKQFCVTGNSPMSIITLKEAASMAHKSVLFSNVFTLVLLMFVMRMAGLLKHVLQHAGLIISGRRMNVE